MNLNSSYGLSFISSVLAGRPGKAFFVSNVTTNDVINQIQNAIRPDVDGVQRFHTTVQSAVNNCVANRGDVIFVLPGHAENIVSATTLVCNKAGVLIQGLGVGAERPTFTFTTSTAATIPVSANNVKIDNCIFNMTGIDAIVAGITPTGTNFTFSNNLVINATATNQATLCILTTAAADRLAVLDNEFLGSNNAGTAAAIRIVGGNEHQIKRNRFYGAYTTSLGAIDNVTTACLRVTVADNVIENATALSTKAMVFVSTSTGSITGNKMQILSGTAPITGAAMSWVGGNYYAAVIATAGTLI